MEVGGQGVCDCSRVVGLRSLYGILRRGFFVAVGVSGFCCRCAFLGRKRLRPLARQLSLSDRELSDCRLFSAADMFSFCFYFCNCLS